MQYFVHGSDNDAVEDLLAGLAEEHWSYMDLHADRLVARGPTLSPDGETHTGSIHVIAAADLEDAQRFAFQEPYCVAGVYATVTVVRLQPALDGTMWDRPQAPSAHVSTLAVVSWPEECSPPDELLKEIGELDQLVFGGLLVNESSTAVLGLVVALDLTSDDSASAVASLELPETATSTLHRWRRGGRHQS